MLPEDFFASTVASAMEHEQMKDPLSFGYECLIVGMRNRGLTLQKIGILIGRSREGVRQLEMKGRRHQAIMHALFTAPGETEWPTIT